MYELITPSAIVLQTFYLGNTLLLAESAGRGFYYLYSSPSLIPAIALIKGAES
jgi:hypothetical protein